MKKFLLILLVSFAIFGCEEEKQEPDYTIVSGSIENPTTDTIAIRARDFLAKIPLAEDGSFADTLDLEQEGYYTLVVGGEISRMYLAPGKDLQLSLNTEQFDESLRYSGEAAPENNYLAQKFLLSEELEIAQDSMKNLSEDALVELSDSQEKAYLELLRKQEGIDSAFAAREQKALAYGDLYTRHLYTVLNRDRYYAEGNQDSLVAFLPDTLDLDRAADYQDFEEYRNLVNIDFFKHTYLLNSEVTSSYEDKAFAYIEDIESDNIRNDFLERISFGVRPGAEKSEEIYSRVMALSTDEEFKKELTKRYELIQKLEPGNPSPGFTYENHKGGQTSLESLRGKYVYMDVWATWCGPCLREIPALKEVEEQYKDRNIHFVSISIDTEEAYDKWRKMVTEKELGGIQLIADNAWNSEFIENYAINGIPRFILVDPEGNIVTADAPRPSNPELTELFESLEI